MKFKRKPAWSLDKREMEKSMSRNKKKKKPSKKKQIHNSRLEALSIIQKLRITPSRDERLKLYAMYLNTKHWKVLSGLVRKSSNYKCSKCGSSKELNIHHLSYDRIGLPGEIDDLVTLCSKCHQEAHGRN